MIMYHRVMGIYNGQVRVPCTKNVSKTQRQVCPQGTHCVLERQYILSAAIEMYLRQVRSGQHKEEAATSA